MSTPTDEFHLDEQQKRRLMRWGLAIALLLLVLLFGSSLMRLQADYWWFKHDVRATVVFSTWVWTRVTLFLIGFAIATPLIYFNARRALTAAVVFDRPPESPAEEIITRILFRAQRGVRHFLLSAALILGFFFALSLAGQWDNWLLFRNAVVFERVDPIFGKDYSFFLFSLPFLRGATGWLLGLVLLNLAVAVVVYYLLRSPATIARVPVTVPSIRSHTSLLAGLSFLMIGLALWFSRYDAATVVGNKFTGAGYTDLQALGAKTIASWALWASAAAALLNTRFWTSYVAVIGGAVVSGLIYFCGVVVWPNIVQAYKVNPNEIELQTPYIKRAITATVWAYGLDKIEVRDLPVQLRPTPRAMQQSATTLENMRLWDPEILRRNVDGLQSLRDYYAFQDIDVDRYVINGKQRMLMVGARDLVVEQVDPGRRNWQNLRLQYTHGNAAVAVPVNEVTSTGMPMYLLKDVPPRGVPELAIKEPRLYYTDSRDASGLPTDRYVLVRSKQPEFDYSAEGEVEHRWTHDGGIPINGAWARTVYSFVFGDKDIFFSNDITPQTRLLFRRNIIERGRKIFPYLKWDHDPYIVVSGGTLLWIADAYSTTDSIPYSAMDSRGGSRLNYIRNSVKFTVNAYTGEWNAYITAPDDPIIRAYNRIYPGLLKPVADAPEDVRRHFRYPEDLFSLQSLQLTLYHVTAPRIFFRKDDAWQIPEQTGITGSATQMSPYYIQMRLPDEPKDGFLLMLPFTPLGRPNMISWLAAHCDRDDYGKLVLYKFPRDRNINGPAQQEAQFEQNYLLSKEVTLLGQVGSRVIHGNLLVIPIGQSVMYVKTLFLESARPGIKALPELKLVVLAFSDKMVFAETYEAALSRLRGGEPEKATKPDTALPGEVARPAKQAPAGQELAGEALRLLEEGKAALREGNWAKFGEAQRKLEQLLRQSAG